MWRQEDGRRSGGKVEQEQEARITLATVVHTFTPLTGCQTRIVAVPVSFDIYVNHTRFNFTAQREADHSGLSNSR